MATLSVHKTAKTAAISCLAADVPAARGGATTSRCIPPQGRQPGAPGQLGERPRLTPPATPKERVPSPFTSSISWALRPQAGGRPALQSAHLAAFYASSELSCHRLISLGSSCRFLLLPKAGFKLVRKVQARGIFILCILMLTAQAKCC